MKILYTFLLIICPFLSSAQNLVENGSFEDGSFDATIMTELNYRLNLDDWDEDASIDVVNESSGHSPDWIDRYLHGVPSPNGDKYVKMFLYELIEQNLSSTTLVEEKSYLVSAKIYLKQPYNETYELTGYEDCDLYFYLANTKINYSNVPSNCDYSECEEYRTIANNNIKIIKKFELDNIRNLEWRKLEFIYNEPSSQTGLSGYDWLGIEMRKNGSTTPLGFPIFIDKVRIVEDTRCTLDDCVRTTGAVVASVPYYFGSPEAPIAVTNLDNIEKAEDIEILSTSGQVLLTLPDVESINGIYNPIFWDGTDGNGNDFVANEYIWRMKLTNVCGTRTYSEQFNRMLDVEEPIPQYAPYNTIIETPLPWCEESVDLIVSDDISGSGRIEFQVLNDLTLQNLTIESSVDDLVLQAGNTITIGSGVVFELGSKVKIEVVEPYSY